MERYGSAGQDTEGSLVLCGNSALCAPSGLGEEHRQKNTDRLIQTETTDRRIQTEEYRQTNTDRDYRQKNTDRRI